MNFTFSKQAHTGKLNVWHNEIFLGEIQVSVKEKENIDWAKYRQDKTLRMSSIERFVLSYIPAARIGNTTSKGLKACSSRKEAAQSLLNYHRKMCKDEYRE